MSHPLIEGLEERTLTVPEYLELLNGLIAPLRVSVEGEITDLKVLREWVFFSLKDAESGAVLRCGLHASAYRKLGVAIEEGMAVKTNGYGKVSPKTGNFGFWVSTIEPVGEGALRRAYELLLARLKEEGMFARKRELPRFISHVGIISSRDGVVLQDLRKNLLPLGLRLDFIHSGVEGPGSAGEIARAIAQFARSAHPPDVLVLIRGGGSLESLQGFNNEVVCRALFACPVPVLVGIGHDVDAPLATLVADWSASTPTAVAHVINASWDPLLHLMPELARTVRTRFSDALMHTKHRRDIAVERVRGSLRTLFAYAERLTLRLKSHARAIPREIERSRERGARAARHSAQVLGRALEAQHRRVDVLERLLGASDPNTALARGYSLTYSSRGVLVRRMSDVSAGDELSTRVVDGTIVSTVEVR